jgi:putative addiction module killer protein
MIINGYIPTTYCKKITFFSRLLGNLGDCHAVGEGVQELRIDYGSGYRVYFGQEGATIVLLLCGGDKSTQNKDIETAKRYWNEYRRRL